MNIFERMKSRKIDYKINGDSTSKDDYNIDIFSSCFGRKCCSNFTGKNLNQLAKHILQFHSEKI